MKTTEKRHRLLFTGGGGAAAEAVFRLWGGRYDVYFADADRDAISPAVPGERRIAIPMARDPAFLPAMLETVRRLGIDVLVPGVDEELLALAHAAPQFAPAHVLLPPAGFIEIHSDKLASMRALHAAGLSAPVTVPFSEAAALAAPFIAKPRSGRGSRGVVALDGHDQMAAYLTLHRWNADAIVAQELIKGQEYTVFVAADAAGRLRAIVPVKVLIKRGITIAAETDAEPVIIDYARRFQAAFRTSGIYNIQLMLRDGVVYPFEINPRVSTTFCLVIAEGYDLIADLIDSCAAPASGGPYVPTRRVALRRNWHNHMEPLGAV